MRHQTWLFYGVTFVVLLALPFSLAPHWTGAMSSTLVAALFALAFSLLMGQGGMLSFGHGAYFAIGCFAAVHGMRWVETGIWNMPTPLLPLVGGVAGLITGAVAGYFATLRSGVYFSMVTLAIAELLHTVAPNVQGVFGGETGVSSMRQPWAGITFGSEREVYYLVLGWFVVCVLAMNLYTRTSFGRLTVALRENEQRVAFLGFDVHRTKNLVFAISCMFAGIAGGLLAVTTESANYVLFGVSYSANVVLFSYIGGIGTFVGPAIGAAAMTLFGFAVSDLTRQWLLYQGLIFIVVMMYAPGGIVEFVSKGPRASGPLRDASPLAAAAAVLPIAMMMAATVFVCELAGRILARDYQARRLRAGAWEPVSLFWQQWSPDRWTTWLVPAFCFMGAALFLAYWARRARAHAVLSAAPQGQR